jgi:polyhydroxyalkanoate synthesis regulator phasin
VIVRAILDNPIETLESFDFFNDYNDTRQWLEWLAEETVGEADVKAILSALEVKREEWMDELKSRVPELRRKNKELRDEICRRAEKRGGE